MVGLFFLMLTNFFFVGFLFMDIGTWILVEYLQWHFEMVREFDTLDFFTVKKKDNPNLRGIQTLIPLEKVWIPLEIINFNRGFPLFSPSILGYPYFWKHPYVPKVCWKR